MCVEQAVAPARNGHSTEAIPSNGNGAHASPARGHALERLVYNTARSPEFIDITDDVREILLRSGLAHGFAVVFSRHTTAAIRINEAEPLLLQDIEEMLTRIAPADVYYRHNDLSIRTVNLTEDEDLNGHSHCQHLLMGASEAIPFADGELLLGVWQRVFLVELDCPRTREVIVQIIGH